jgi:hypothetical protein
VVEPIRSNEFTSCHTHLGYHVSKFPQLELRNRQLAAVSSRVHFDGNSLVLLASHPLLNPLTRCYCEVILLG